MVDEKIYEAYNSFESWKREQLWKNKELASETQAIAVAMFTL